MYLTRRYPHRLPCGAANPRPLPPAPPHPPPAPPRPAHAPPPPLCVAAPTLEITQKRSEHPAPDGRVDLALKMRRRVSGEYSNLCLNLMYEMAKEAGLLFDAIPDEDSWSYPEELAAICDSLKSQIVNGVDAPQLVPKQRMLLKQRYTHCSSHYNPIRFMLGEQEVSMEFPFQPWGHPLRPTPTRKRTVHYQQGIGKA